MSINTKEIVLKTENLTIGYQQKKQTITIAENINLDFKKGNLVAVLGENGIGKSTLLRTLSKVQKPISGTVFINQKNIVNISEKELSKQLSLVLTERLPESQLTVFELIALGRQPYTNWIDKLSENDILKINWAIEQTNIQHLKNNRFYQLSDGQLQRVLIARALAQDTEIIILDEPTAHLDMQQTIIIFELLKRLATTTQKTILISTHEVNLATKICNQLVLMTANNIISGTTENLIEKNAFQELFSSEIINFNTSLQQFVINKN